MNVGANTGITSSAAGAPLSQTAGAETERAKKDANAQQRLAESQTKSEKASGIGQTEQDEQTSDRDADGRRLWEAPDAKEDNPDEQEDAARKPKDPAGISGNSLDLTG